MTSPRDALNDLKWHRHALERAHVTYVHRGVEGDERTVEGAEILELGASFMELRSRGPMPAMIPYHRVLRIELDGALVWERVHPTGGTKTSGSSGGQTPPP